MFYRLSWLRHLQILSEAGHLNFPGIHDGETEDAVFKALAIVPMTGRRPGVTYEGPPFDVEELIRLIKKEYEALGDDHPQAHLTNRMIPTNAQPMASRPEAIMSKSERMPPPAVNPTKANLPTTAKTKAQPSHAHQGKSDGLINIAAKYMLSIGPGHTLFWRPKCIRRQTKIEV